MISYNFSVDVKKVSEPKENPLESSQNERIIDLGLSLEKLVLTMNNTIRELLTTFYTATVLSCILISFQLTATLKAEDFNCSNERKIIFCGYIFSSLMYLTRLKFLTESGQRLGTSINQSKRALEEHTLANESSFVLTTHYSSKLKVLQKRLDTYQLVHPISPYSMYNLSRKTFYSTLALIITYIVVLIKLRDGPKQGSDNSIGSCNLQNQTITKQLQESKEDILSIIPINFNKTFNLAF